MSHETIVSAFWWAFRHHCLLAQLVGFLPLSREDSFSWLSASNGRGPILFLPVSVLAYPGGFRMLSETVRNLKARINQGGLRFISNRGPTSASWTCFGGTFTNTWCLATGKRHIHEHT